jgi:hypothetical protein
MVISGVTVLDPSMTMVPPRSDGPSVVTDPSPPQAVTVTISAAINIPDFTNLRI